MWFKIIIFLLLALSLEELKGSEYEDSEIALHHFMQGEFLMNQGNYSLAILEFQDAIDLDPNASTIHVSIAEAYLKLGKTTRSKSHLLIAIDLNPEEYEALEILGEFFVEFGVLVWFAVAQFGEHFQTTLDHLLLDHAQDAVLLEDFSGNV